MAQFSYKGFDIEVNSSGYFTATVDAVEFTKPTLIELRDALDAELKLVAQKVRLDLPIVGIRRTRLAGFDTQIVNDTIVGINRNSGSLSFRLNNDLWLYILPDYEANRQLLTAWKQATEHEQVLRKKVEACRLGSPTSGRISAESYAGWIDKLKQLYEQQSAKTNSQEK